MADDVKKKETARQINEKDRFRYIGFEVFPGKPKDLFQSDAEKEKLIDVRRKKRESGDLIREECTLFDDRVSRVDRVVLTLASLAMVAALFIPWFSAYNEIEKTAAAPQSVTDTLAISGGEVAGDSLALAVGTAAATADSAVAAVTGQVAETPLAAATTEEVAAGEEATGGSETASEQTTPNEEVLHGYVAKKQFYKEFTRVSGFGALLSLGSVGSVAFSSGLALALISILAIVMILVCLAFPVYTLYVLYAAKGSSDTRALQLKTTLQSTARRSVRRSGVSAMASTSGCFSIRCRGAW